MTAARPMSLDAWASYMHLRSLLYVYESWDHHLPASTRGAVDAAMARAEDIASGQRSPDPIARRCVGEIRMVAVQLRAALAGDLAQAWREVGT